MAFNYCDPADIARIESAFENDQNDNKKLLYKYICPILLIVCVTSIILNSLLINISRQSRFVGRKSSILLLSLNLAITDVIASLMNTVSLFFNSWLNVVYGVSMNRCVMLTLDAIRIAAIMSSALHLLALAFAHYGSIAWPIQYRSFILLPSKTINIISIFCWTISLTITISSFLVTECQGFRTLFDKLECETNFALSFNYKYILFVAFLIPLVLMSIIYARIFIIISEHQRKRRIEHERSISLAGPTGAALSVAVNLSELESRSPAPASGGGELCPVCTAKTQMRNENDYDQDDDEFSSSSDATDSDNRSDDDERRHAHFSEESGAGGGGGGGGSIGSRRLKYKLYGCGEETKSGGVSVIFEDERSHDSATATATTNAAAATCATSATDRRPSTGQSYSCSNSTIIYKDPTGSEDLQPIVASQASSGSSGLRNDDDVFVSNTARSPNGQFRLVESKNSCDSNNNGNHNSLFLSSNNDDNRKSRAVETIVRPANSVGSGKFETTYYDNKGQRETQQQQQHQRPPTAHDEGIVFILNDTTGGGSSSSNSSGSTSRGAPESNPAAAAVLTPTQVPVQTGCLESPFMKLKQGTDTTKETPNQANSDCRSSGSGGHGGGGGRISGQVSLVDHASAASDNVDYSIRRGTSKIASIVARHHQSRECDLQGAQNSGQMGHSVGSSGDAAGEGCAEEEESRHLNRRISRESLLKAKQSVVVIGGGGGGQVSETNKPNQKDSQWCRTSAMSAPPLCENNNNDDDDHDDDHENEARTDQNNFQNGANDKQKQQRKRSSCSKRGSLDKGKQNHFATTSGAGYASGKCAPSTVDARVDYQAIQIGRPHKRASKRKHSNATSRSSDNNNRSSSSNNNNNNNTDNLLLKKCTCDNKLKQSSMKLSRANTIGFTGGEQQTALAKSTSTATQPKAQPTTTTTTTTSSSVVGQCRSRPTRAVVTKSSVETGSSSILSGCNATVPLKLQPSVQANYFTSITEQDQQQQQQQQQQKSNTTTASSATFTRKTTAAATTTTTTTTATATATTTTPTSTTPLRTNSNSLTTAPLDQATTSAFATSSCAMKAAPTTTTMTVTMATAMPSSNKTINKTASTTAIAARQSGAGCHELQRVNVHPSAEPHTNTKAAMTTFYILGTYFACYAPSNIAGVLTCIDDSRCPYSILEFTPANRTLLGGLTFMLLLIKPIIDALIYTYRMNEIKEGISRYLSSRRLRKSSSQHGVSMNTSQRFGASSHTSGGGAGGNSMYSNRSNNCSQANSSSFRLLTGRSGGPSTDSAIRSSATSNPSRHTNQRLSRQTTTTTMTSSCLRDDHSLLRQHQSKPLIVNIYTNDGSLNSSSSSSKPNGSINAIDKGQQSEQLTKIVAGAVNASEKNNSIDQINENRLLIEIGSSIEDDKSDSAVPTTMINEFARPLSTKVAAAAAAAGVNLLDEDDSVVAGAAGSGKFANKESCSSGGKMIPMIDKNPGPKCSPMAHQTIDKSSSPISSSFSGPIQSSSDDFKLDTSNLVC